MAHKGSTIDPAKKWNGPVRQYDLVKEIVIATLVVGFLALSLAALFSSCLLYTSPSPRDRQKSRMPSSA